MRILLPMVVLLLSACAGAQLEKQKKELAETREKAGALLVQVKEKSDEADAAKAAKADADAKLADVEGKLAIANTQIDSLTKSNKQLTDASGASQSDLGGKLNEAVADKDALAKKVSDLGKEKLALERAKTLYRAARDKAVAELEKTKAERDALAIAAAGAAQAQAKSEEARLKLATDTREQLGGVADVILKEMQAGKAGAVSDGGSFTVTASADLLFDDGSAKIREEGAAFLEKLGAALKALGPRAISVGAYADNAPVKKGLLGGFEDSWALTSARAAAVARWLHQHAGLDPARLDAAGYGEFRPLKPNDSDEGRAVNRRVTIAVNRIGTP